MQIDTLSKEWLLLGHKNDFSRSCPNKIVIKSVDIVVAYLDGNFKAFIDICPHRLSSFEGGKIQNNHLVCPYHGSEFDSNGSLKNVPAIKPCKKTPSLNLKSFNLHEDTLGLLWINFNKDDSAPFIEDFQASFIEGDNLHFNYELRTSPLPILENFVDCSHTNFVHGGLFRGAPMNEVKVKVETSDRSVKITTTGEKNTDAFLPKLFNPSGNELVHIDEFLAPYTVKVIYQLRFLKITTVSVLTPIEEMKTKVKTIVNIQGNFLLKLFKPLLNLYVWKILKQDTIILERQSKNLRKINDSFFSHDIPIIEIHKVYHAFKNGTSVSSTLKTFEMIL